MCTYNFHIVGHNPNKVLFYYICLILVTINISSNTFCDFKCLVLKQNIGNLISKQEHLQFFRFQLLPIHLTENNYIKKETSMNVQTFVLDSLNCFKQHGKQNYYYGYVHKK